MLENMLLFAIQKNLQELVEKIVAHHDYSPSCASLALIECCTLGNYTSAKFLVENGADIRVEQDSCLNMVSSIVLIKAAKYGHLECVDLCLNNNCDPKSNENYSLSWAARNGHSKVVQRLLSANAPIDFQVFWILLCRTIELCNLLVSMGKPKPFLFY